MKTSRSGIAFIQKWEGCKLTAYQDVKGVWTIGYGHTSMAGPPAVTPGLRISQQEASDIFVRDLVRYEAAVEKALNRVPSQHQFDAMVSLCYNIGPGAFASSSVARHFNAGDMARAAASFALFRKSGGKVVQGLVNRRAAETALFQKPPAKPVQAPAPAPVAVQPPSAPKAAPAPAKPSLPPMGPPAPSLWAWFKALFKKG